MTPRSAQREHQSKSIKTFLIYAGIVLFFIILSLAAKAFFLVQQSRFDASNEFIISIAQNNSIKELVLLNPTERSVTLLKLKGTNVGLSSLEKTLGIIPDAYIDSPVDLSGSAFSETARSVAFKYHSLKTDLTIFDAVGLFWSSQKTTYNKSEEKEMFVAKNADENDKIVKNLFLDDKIFSENVSIQIINSSNVPGMGKRLERVLSHLGCNIVSVSSSRQEEKTSKIQYFGTESYTLQKLKKILDFPSEKTEKKSIATIVIVIGKDISSSMYFK